MIHVGNCKLTLSKNSGTQFREIGTNFLKLDLDFDPRSPTDGSFHFGDFKAKVNKEGKIPKTAYPAPDIQLLSINKDLDFLLLANNNFYDMKTLSTKPNFIEQNLWQLLRESLKTNPNLHEACGNTVNGILRDAINLNGDGNLTCMLILLNKREHYIPSDRKSRNTRPSSNKENLTASQLNTPDPAPILVSEGTKIDTLLQYKQKKNMVTNIAYTNQPGDYIDIEIVDSSHKKPQKVGGETLSTSDVEKYFNSTQSESIYHNQKVSINCGKNNFMSTQKKGALGGSGVSGEEEGGTTEQRKKKLRRYMSPDQGDNFKRRLFGVMDEGDREDGEAEDSVGEGVDRGNIFF